MQSGDGTAGGEEEVRVVRFQTGEGYRKGVWDCRCWGRLRPNFDVAKKADARVPGSPVKLVCAVLLRKLYKSSFSL